MSDVAHDTLTHGEEALNALSSEPAKVVISEGLSYLDLFLGAGLSVKVIMVILMLASIWSWTIIFHKIYRLKRLNNYADQFEEAFWAGGALDDLFERVQNHAIDPMSLAFCAAMREWRRSINKGMNRVGEFRASLEERIERAMHLSINREVDAIDRGMGMLSSLGSNGVIIGLFGTVLGIMDSFEPIAMQQGANLASIAPDIAEALFATAIGLVAAIPAAIAYNKLSTDIQRYNNRLTAFASEFGSIVSRQLEEHP